MNTLTNQNGQEFDVHLFFSHTFKGRGGWNINIEASYKGEKFNTHVYTTNSGFIDEIHEMGLIENGNSWEDIQAVYCDAYLSQVEEELIQWCESVDAEEAAEAEEEE